MKKFPREDIFKLQSLVDLLEEAREPMFQSVNPKASIFFLDTSNFGINYKGIPVKNIRYINESYMEKNVYANNAHLVLGLANGKRMVVFYASNAEYALDYMKTIQALFFEYGLPDIYTPQNTTQSLAWRNVSQESCYQITALTNYYEGLYQVYAQYILKILAADTSNRPVFIVEPGCGDARCSKFIADHIKQRASRDIYTAGFDINAENVAKAKAKFPETEQFFINSNFSEISHFIQHIQPLYQRLQNSFTIVIFSGVLCELVATGSRQSLRMMQYTYRELSPSLTVLGGHTDNFVNKRMISRTGMQIVELCNGPKDKEVYFLQPETEEQFIAKQIRWSDKRAQDGRSKNNLDLSMSIHPIKALQALENHNASRLQTVTQLDLSDALLKPDELKEAAKEIHRLLPMLKHVLFTKTDEWSVSFAELLRSYFPNMVFLYRLDSPNAETIPAFSVPMARDMKLFKAMPNEKLILPKVEAQIIDDMGPAIGISIAIR
ncbi:MAG: hypothetical protein ACO1N3_01565 [Gammaproteobacteria bacterium]